LDTQERFTSSFSPFPSSHSRVVTATYGKFIKSCTARPLGPKFAKETHWLHDGCYYHPDMGCLFWCDDAMVPPATLEGEIIWRWGCYLARDIECLRTVMWVREDEPVTMVEDVCNEEIWAGGPRKVAIQPWDQDLTPKPEMGTWGTREEEVTWGEQEVAPRYEEGWFKATFPDVWRSKRLTLMPLGPGMRSMRNGSWMNPGGMGRWRTGWLNGTSPRRTGHKGPRRCQARF
jgi:hypothetical protein